MGKKRKIINSAKYARKYANHPLARAKAAAGSVAESLGDVVEDIVDAAAEVVETVAETTAEVVEAVVETVVDVVKDVAEVVEDVVEDVAQATQDVVSTSERKEVKKKTGFRGKSKKV